MKKILTIIFVFVCISSYPQVSPSADKDMLVSKLLDSLWVNPTSFFNKTDPNWRMLCTNLHHIDMQKLNQITTSIYSGSENIIENASTSDDGLLGSLNKSSNKKRLRQFNRKPNDDFSNKTLFPNNKTVLVEGDSWFEYPMFLRDITDNLIKEDNLAVYSIASGGDWASNMISSGEYQTEYLVFKPDVFIISGGGNDLLEENRLTKLISDKPIPKNSKFLGDYREYVILRQNEKPVPLCNANFCPIEYHNFEAEMPLLTSRVDTATLNMIVNGRRYLNKKYYRFLVAFKLEYKILFESLNKMDSTHFDSLKIITQGYDYAIPNSKRKFGVRMFIENGTWLKKPLEKSGITDSYTQKSIIMALIFDFNEMLIELGKEYPNIYHVDSRGFIDYFEKANNKKQGTYWYDELHPAKQAFAEISKVYISVINKEFPPNKRVFSVVDFYKNANK
jgi:hypothetical protein